MLRQRKDQLDYLRVKEFLIITWNGYLWTEKLIEIPKESFLRRNLRFWSIFTWTAYVKRKPVNLKRMI